VSSNDGRHVGICAQSDVVDLYGLRLNEELEYENIRTHYIDTRRGKPRDYIQEVPDGFVPILLSCDWHNTDRKCNASVVEYCGEPYSTIYKLADALCFTLGEWGRAHVFEHRVMRPRNVSGQGKKEFIRVKPFALNGPHADEYMRRLDKLGEDLGRAIGGFLAGLGQGKRA
jgi:hypothetical protein